MFPLSLILRMYSPLLLHHSSNNNHSRKYQLCHISLSCITCSINLFLLPLPLPFPPPLSNTNNRHPQTRKKMVEFGHSTHLITSLTPCPFPLHLSSASSLLPPSPLSSLSLLPNHLLPMFYSFYQRREVQEVQKDTKWTYHTL